MRVPLTACVLAAERRPSALRVRMGGPYTPAQAAALHALAESRPTPAEYERARDRILGRA